MAQHAQLVTVAQLPRYGVAGQFLSGFALVPIVVAIDTAGALGTMTIKWKRIGDTAYSEVIYSPAGSTWTVDLDSVTGRAAGRANCSIVFAAGTYVASSTYTVALDGTIARAGSAIDTVTASRYDLREIACDACTEEAIGMMGDAITPPLTAWGDDIKRRTADMVHLMLRRAKGMAPGGSGAAGGDDDVLAADAEARAYFVGIGKAKKTPPSVVDSSAVSYGPIYRDPVGDTLRGY